MNTKRNIIGVVLVLFAIFAIARAQQPTPSPSPSPQKSEYTETPSETGEKAGDFTVVSSLEFGYRGLRVDGDLNKYQSDLNYKAGPRVFDSSFLLKSTDCNARLFETFLATSTGWGADPQGNLRVSVEHPKWYRFDAA